MKHRDIGPILRIFRNILFGRKHTLAVRFEDQVSCRSPEPPNLPKGPYDKISANYYHKRNSRFDLPPPIDVTQPLIGDKDEKPKKKSDMPTPGDVYKWDHWDP